MYVRVKLLNGFPEPLLYQVPQGWQEAPPLGSLVMVPLRNRTEHAVVMEHHQRVPQIDQKFLIKELQARDQLPDDVRYLPFIQSLSAYYHLEPYWCIKRIRHFVAQQEEREILVPEAPEEKIPKTTLTDEQQCARDRLVDLLAHNAYAPAVLHGVTGSGKTEIYKELVVAAHAQQKSTVLLLPEVSLALQFERILRTQLPRDITISSFHSATRMASKKDLWQLLRTGTPQLIIGVHLPILLPIGNLGLIIVDEEHECGYQEKKHPRINSKEAALMRAQKYQIPIVLGSATPSISSLYNVHQRNWLYLQLHKRYRGAFPRISVVYLTDKQKRRNFWISTELEHAIAQRLADRQQTIIFINRRGYSFFVQCDVCSNIPHCNNCSVSLTLHENNRLSCHYCGTNQLQPPFCLACKADESHLIKKGVGTQQVVSIVQALFPRARIGRADLDVSSHKKVWQKTVHDFEAGNLDILVGTQTITKGFHFPHVTLVGILWADINLHFPVYNATETTIQQLLQVAGRAGRQHETSEVIVQAMAPHPLFDTLHETAYQSFYEQEMASRTQAGYPPFMRLYELEVRHPQEHIVEDDAHTLVAVLKNLVGTNQNIHILGPARPPVHRIKNMCMRKIYLKGPSATQISAYLRTIDQSQYQSAIFITPNPIN